MALTLPKFSLGLLSFNLYTTISNARSYSPYKRQNFVPDVLPGTWTSLGCYVDVGRTLTGGGYDDNIGMTDESCIAYCESLGFIYAGTEYYHECYCGNSLEGNAGPANPNDCSTPCAGDHTESCGGGNRLSLFYNGASAPEVVPSVGPWSYIGCYEEGAPGRVLETEVTLPGGAAMTVEGCTAACQDYGYVFAGVEFGNECWCGDDFENGGGPAIDGDTLCTMTCKGDHSELCGGPLRLQMYGFGNALAELEGPVSPTSTIATTSSPIYGAAASSTVVSSSPSSSTDSSAAASSSVSTSSDPSAAASSSYPSTTSSYGSSPSSSFSSDSSAAASSSTSFSAAASSSVSSTFPSSSTSSIDSSAAASCSSVLSAATACYSLFGSTALPSAFPSYGPSGSCSQATVTITVTASASFSSSYPSAVVSSSSSSDPPAATSSGPSDPSAAVSSSSSFSSDSAATSSSDPSAATSSSFSDPPSAAASSSTSSDPPAATSSSASSSSVDPPAAASSGYSSATSVSSSPSSSTSAYVPTIPTPSTVPSALDGQCTFVGCYTEGTISRALKDDFFIDYETMTVEICASYCSSKGYSLFGVEWSGECYCGNQLQPGSIVRPVTECNMLCDGAPYQFCGAGNRLDVYSCSATPSSPSAASSIGLTAPTPTTVQGSGSYTLSGCYTEGTNTRALTGGALIDYVGMTVEMCASYCTPEFSLFGLEWSGECYCGDVLQAGSIQVDSSECNMPCDGNENETCGAGRRLNVYSYSPIASTPAIATTSTSITTASTASTSTAGTSTAGTSAAPTGAATSSATVPSATPNTQITGPETWTYYGCQTEGTVGRALAGKATAYDTMTLESCAADCDGFLYFGVEYGRECYCGNTFSFNSAPALATDCYFPCAGDDDETCGAGLRLSVYVSTSAPPADTKQTNVPTVAPFSYYGCRTEGPNVRALPSKATAYDTMTIESCAADCVGYSYFGVEYGRECYCGNAFSKGSFAVPNGECKFPCAGDADEVCGAGSRLSVYEFS